jgi:DNA-binding transcriptional MerR regulator
MTVYNNDMNQLWTIEQLAILVEMALRTVSYDGQKSGRVRALPDRRTIRYYTTLGLLDPPAEMRGRKAFYGRRHVLQLVALKRLQAQGMSLVQIQQVLTGADNRSLARWSAVPADFWEPATDRLLMEQPLLSAEATLAESAEEGKTTPRSVDRDRDRFWAAGPAFPPVANSAASPVCEPPAPRSAVHLAIGPGVELVMEGMDARQLDREAFAYLTPILDDLAQALQELRRTSARPPADNNMDSITSDPSHPEP